MSRFSVRGRRVVSALVPCHLGRARLPLCFYGARICGRRGAYSIGWPTGNPFQFEVALHDLAVGILGVLCFWLRGDFWSATVIAYAVFGLEVAYGHIRDIRIHRNYAPGNAGPVLYLNDILLPFLLVVLLIAYRV